MGKVALICGVSGQDGAYLARLLLGKGYTVVGTSRDAQVTSFQSLERLGVRERVRTLSMSLTDFRSVYTALTQVKPDEIYNLAGQTSVGLSFEQPVETLESIATGTLNLLEALRLIGGKARFYNAGSSECFGDTGELPATEQTAFRPRSPYAVAKATAHWEVANYREAYGLFACTGILFNHESPLRPQRFVTQKIVSAARRIAAGDRAPLNLGSLEVSRDWGWAEEYVEAMWRMLNHGAPDDYVVATGETHTLAQFVEAVFAKAGLDWREHVKVDASLKRATDIRNSRADPSKARRVLGWAAKRHMDDVAAGMLSASEPL